MFFFFRLDISTCVSVCVCVCVCVCACACVCVCVCVCVHASHSDDSVSGDGVTKRAASGPFGTFCHHVMTKRAATNPSHLKPHRGHASIQQSSHHFTMEQIVK